MTDLAQAVCRNGHPFDEANTYHVSTSGRRQCRACNRAAVERYRSKGGRKDRRTKRPSRARATPYFGDGSIEWRTLDWLPGYEISENGDVRRTASIPYHPPRMLGGCLSRGYRYFFVLVDGKMRSKAAHRLVCEAFHGPPPPGVTHAAHANGQKDDNRYTNLRWATPKENAADKLLHGTLRRGEAHPMAKLDWPTVRAIREAYTGRTGDISAISRRFGLGVESTRRIIRGLRWKEDAA